jgi:anti-anti-sigma factor
MADDKLQMDLLDSSRLGEKIIVLQGVLNAETAFTFRDFVRQHEPTNVVIDMTNVRSVDSSGLGVLIGLYISYERKCRRLLLAGLNDRIWDLFSVCNIESVFTRYPSVAAAEEAVPLPAESVASS